MSNLTIGQLARHLGVGASTLRYYERVGLLKPLTRTAAGYRLYGRDAATRLRFIRRAQDLGFSLDEIAQLLALSDDPRADAGAVKELTREKIADIEARIRDLQRMKKALTALEASCSGRGHTAHCPILAALNDAQERAPAEESEEPA